MSVARRRFIAGWPARNNPVDKGGRIGLLMNPYDFIQPAETIPDVLFTL